MTQHTTIRSKSKEIFLYLLFVGIATAVWWGHAMSSVRNMTLPVTVQYTGVPNNIGFTDSLPTVLLVKVRDTGERLRGYHQNPPILSFDLSQQLQKDNGTILVSQDVVRRNLTDQLRGTSHVQEIEPSEFKTTFYREQEKIVPIRLNVEVSPAAQYQMVGEPIVSEEKVHIFGKKSTLDAIKYIETEPYVIGNVRDTMRVLIPLVCPEDIRLIRHAIEVCYVSERYTEKVVTLPIVVRNVPNEQQIHLFPAEATVTMNVSLAHFMEVSDEDLNVYCTYSSNAQNVLKVETEIHSPYVSHPRVYPAYVEYLIENATHESHPNGRFEVAVPQH